MQRNPLRILLLVVLLAPPVAICGCSPSREEPALAFELETRVNTLDGCTGCGCRARGELEPGTKHPWWASFGVVASDGETAWEATGSSSHCRTGLFESVATDFGRTVGTPYVILDLSTTPRVTENEAIVEMELRIRKFSAFDAIGQPVYDRSIQRRTLRFSREGDITLPLIVSDQREESAFGVHEVLVRLRARRLDREPAAAYGILSVSADVPGAEILLDGGSVGRIAEGSPTVLRNVLAGKRQITVRDFSGREARHELVVEKGSIAEVALAILSLEDDTQGNGLMPLGKNPQGHEEFWRVADAATVVRVPAGEFWMGSPEGEGQTDEAPQHRIYLSDFLVDKTEVTWRQLRKFNQATGAALPRAPIWGTHDHYPAVFVLWEEAGAYCEWVGGRLPTEAEWEKAARGVNGWRYSWGDDWDAGRCNSISGGLHQPEYVGSRPRCVSPYGVLDMPGSMWEWCADRYGETYYSESPSRDPRGPADGRLRVMRGGAWMTQPTWLRAAYRFKASPVSRNADHGFRCVHDPPDQP